MTDDETISVYCWLCTGRIVTTNNPAAMGYGTDGVSEHKHCRVAHEMWLADWREHAAETKD